MSTLTQLTTATTAGQAAQLAGSERLIATLTADANSSADQNLYTCTGELIVTRVIFDNVSASLLLAVAELGFNAGVDDINVTVTLATLTTTGLFVIATPKLGAANGAAAAVLKVHFTTLAGTAATVRVRVYGIGG